MAVGQQGTVRPRRVQGHRQDQFVLVPVTSRVADFSHAVVDAVLGEILTTLAKMDWIIKHGEKELRPQKRRGNFILMHKSSYVYYEPLGVVAAIVSWNYRACTVSDSRC